MCSVDIDKFAEKFRDLCWLVVEAGGDDVQRVDHHGHHEAREQRPGQVAAPGAAPQLRVPRHQLLYVAVGDQLGRAARTCHAACYLVRSCATVTDIFWGARPWRRATVPGPRRRCTPP